MALQWCGIDTVETLTGKQLAPLPMPHGLFQMRARSRNCGFVFY